MNTEPIAERGLRREADVLIEVGHPSRPDREELIRQHIARIKARAWDEGFIAARGHLSDYCPNPYRATPPDGGESL